MNFVPSMANFPRRDGGDDKSTSSDGTVEEPTETEQRYAALRNHQIRFADAIDPNAERVYKLRKKDIVFGRGRGFQNHPGNERMRDIIEKYKTQYHSLNRDGKRKLVEAVYEEITASGARFLKKLDGENVWVVVDLPIALQKVSHTMRCRKSIIRQLDENGNVPTTLGGAAGRPGAMPGMAALAGMPGSAAIPRMAPGMAPGITPGMAPGMTPIAPGMTHAGIPSASASAIPGMIPSAAIPGMGASAAGIPGMPPGMPPSVPGMLPGASAAAGYPGVSPLGASSMYPTPPTSAVAATAAGSTTDTSLAALEAQRTAALHRYRVLSGMAVARQGDIEYYQTLRREQLLRETRMLQQMGDAALLGGPTPPTSGGMAGGMNPGGMAGGMAGGTTPGSMTGGMNGSMMPPTPNVTLSSPGIPSASMGLPGAGAPVGLPGSAAGNPVGLPGSARLPGVPVGARLPGAPSPVLPQTMMSASASRLQQGHAVHQGGTVAEIARRNSLEMAQKQTQEMAQRNAHEIARRNSKEEARRNSLQEMARRKSASKTPGQNG